MINNTIDNYFVKKQSNISTNDLNSTAINYQNIKNQNDI